MYARRTALAALGVVALLAGSAQGASITLDGQRRTSHAYDGQLDEATSQTAQGRNAVDTMVSPTPTDCAKTSCDVRTIVLTVPKGRQSGRLTYNLQLRDGVTGSSAFVTTATVAMYDASGEEVLSTGGPASCCVGSMQLRHPRFKPGTYKVIIYNQGPPTLFDARLTWIANPPHRSSVQR